jgi:septal ring factor EnvC (AmiA/AmiB activator)
MPQQIPSHIMSADQFIATLPYQFRDTPENTRQKIEEEMRRSDDKSEKIHELETRIKGLEKALTDTTTKLHSTIQEKNALQNALDRSKDKFFNHIMRLEEEMTKWDGSINTKIRVQEKTDVFRLIQEVLTRIRYYQGEIDADPARAREALRTYKIAKGFKDEELWDTITKETIISIVRDYADTLLKESRG